MLRAIAIFRFAFIFRLTTSLRPSFLFSHDWVDHVRAASFSADGGRRVVTSRCSCNIPAATNWCGKCAASGANGGAAQGGVARELFPPRERHSCGARSTRSLEQKRSAREQDGFDADRNVRPFVRRGYDPGCNRRDVSNERHRTDRSKNSRRGHS